MNRKSKMKTISATVASLFVAGAPIVGWAAGEGKDQVMCSGINACKGQGSCAGASNACAGKNGCKGQGMTKVSRKDCMAKGGKVAEKKK